MNTERITNLCNLAYARACLEYGMACLAVRGAHFLLSCHVWDLRLSFLCPEPPQMLDLVKWCPFLQSRGSGMSLAQVCLLCHTADVVCCIPQQACLLCHTTDMSVVSPAESATKNKTAFQGICQGMPCHMLCHGICHGMPLHRPWHMPW